MRWFRRRQPAPAPVLETLPPAVVDIAAVSIAGLLIIIPKTEAGRVWLGPRGLGVDENLQLTNAPGAKLMLQAHAEGLTVSLDGHVCLRS